MHTVCKIFCVIATDTFGTCQVYTWSFAASVLWHRAVFYWRHHWITPKDKTRRKARNELPLEKRFQNVEEYENSKGLTGVRKFAEKFGCGKTQVSNILKQKTLVREEYERGFSSAKKRNSSSQYSNVNDAVWEWFKKKTEQRIPVEEARSQIAVNCCFLRFCYWGKEETSCNRKVCESKVPEEYKQRWSSLSVFESTEGLDDVRYPSQAPQPVKQLFQGPESINTFIHWLCWKSPLWSQRTLFQY